MSKAKRSRRPGGHPAKVAARRGRGAAGRSRTSAGPDGVARRIVREVQGLTSAFDAELWASQLLGVLSSQRYALPLEEAASPDHLLTIGEPLIKALARVGGSGAGIALTVISRVDDGELGVRAGKLAAKAESGPENGLPSWIDHVGDAKVTGAAVMHEDVFDDACTVFSRGATSGWRRSRYRRSNRQQPRPHGEGHPAC